MNPPAATEIPAINPADLTALRLLADGLTVDQTATRLRLGKSAMCMRLSRMRERIGATTNAHAVAIAIRAGQLNLDLENTR